MKLWNFPETLIKGEADGDGSAESNPAVQRPSLFQLMKIDGVATVLFSYFILSMAVIMYDETFSLWAMSSRANGGLLMSSAHIGNIMTLIGVVLVVYTAVLYPILANTLGPRMSFFLGQLSFIPCVLLITLTNRIHVKEELLIVIVASVSVLGKMGTNLAFSAIALLVNQCVESNLRGTINGLSMTVGSIAKAIGPILGSVSFAWSLANGRKAYPFDFHFVFLMIAMLSALNCLVFLKFLRRVNETQAVTAPSTAATAENYSDSKRESGGDDEDAVAASLELVVRGMTGDGGQAAEMAHEGSPSWQSEKDDARYLGGAAEGAGYGEGPASPTAQASGKAVAPITSKAFAILSGHATLSQMRGTAAYTTVATQDDQDDQDDQEDQEDLDEESFR